MRLSLRRARWFEGTVARRTLDLLASKEHIGETAMEKPVKNAFVVIKASKAAEK